MLNRKTLRFDLAKTFFYFVFVFSFASPSIASGPVDWHKDYDSAARSAKKADQILLVQIYSPSCPYCVKMDREVFYNSKMSPVCKKMRCVKVNGLLDAKGVELMRRYRIPGYPATLLLSAQGDLVSMIYGYVPLKRFMNEVEQSVKQQEEFLQHLMRVRKGDKNAELLYKILRTYYERQNFEKSLEFATRVISVDPENKAGKTPEAYLFKAASLLSVERKPENSFKILDKVIKKWPKAESAKSALFMKGVLLIELRRRGEAKSVFLQFKKQYPDDPRFNKRVERILAQL